MSFLIWNDSYTVGVEELDHQHMGLFAMANEVYTAMLSGQSEAVTAEMLDKLVNYTHEHFSAEEALMEAAHYPKLDFHRTHHRDLTQQVNKYLARFDQGENLTNIDMLNFFNDWLTNHILKEDKEYSPWLGTPSN